VRPTPATPYRRGLILAVLVLLFAGGFIASYALLASGWRPVATKNYGELVEPPREIRDVALVDAEGRSVSFAAYKGKWTLLYFGSAECLKACTENLYKMRQITAAQGLEAHRIQRVFVVTDARARDLLRYTIADYPGTDLLFGDAAALRALAMQFRLDAGSPLDRLERVYIVDPLGNFMMSYAPDADPRGMNKDLARLLRASHIG
jgi:cytochrome oxidase Cu insertion factor (SCO1/SenC/PrrC family)